MKDIVITSKSVRRELLILLGCLVLAEGVNLGAIVAYGRPLSELYSMIGYVVFIAVIVYLLVAVVRVLVHLILKIFKHK